MNHLVAIFMGALIKNGCPIAVKHCPIITNGNPTFTKHRIMHPRNVRVDPMTIPFLIPFTSITQLDGKFTNM